MMKKLRVGVFMGGKSSEREVSFNSGRTVCDHLDTCAYEIIPIFQDQQGQLYQLPWHFLHRGKISDFEHRLQGEAQKISWDALKQLIDFAYICLHGQYAEDGTIQGFFEVLGIPYLGSKVLASALCMDKIAVKKILKAQGIDVPFGCVFMPEDLQKSEKNCVEYVQAYGMEYPLVVKPYKEGSSLGITVVHHETELMTALERACWVNKNKPQAVIVEEKIEGMEFSCILLRDYTKDSWLPLPPTEIVPEQGSHFFDYEQKYMPGRAHKFTPARVEQRLIQKIQDICCRASDILGIATISRIDGFLTRDQRVVIVDPNTLSGMGPASFLFREAAEINMSHTRVINHLIETELHQYGIAQFNIDKKEIAMNAPLFRVGVLMGGNSNEREISLESGRNICYKLSPQKYQVLPIFINSSMELFQIDQSLLVKSSTHEIAELLQPSSRIAWHDLPNLVDFVFIGLHGGHGENGHVQGILHMLEIPYNGSGVFTSALCMDKFKTTQFLSSQGFDVPRGILLTKEQWKEHKSVTLQEFPLIVKPHDDGCSVLVQKVASLPMLHAAIDEVFASGKQAVLIEECVTGMELTVGVVGNEQPRALPPSQAVATRGILSIEEKFLPGAGENQTPAPLPEAALAYVRSVIEKVYASLECKGYARIDCFYQSAEQFGKERVIILEVNTLPGLTPATCIFHQAAEVGIKPMDFIDMIVELGMQEHRWEVVADISKPDAKLVYQSTNN